MSDPGLIFRLPDLGEGLEEAEIVAWHVGVGDHVVADQLLVSVETDKAVVEVPSPRAGVIEKLFAAAGEIVKVGDPLVAFGAPAAAVDAGAIVGELASAPDAPAPAATAVPASSAAPPPPPTGRKLAAPAARALAREAGLDIAAVRPSAGAGHIGLEDVRAVLAARPAPTEPAAGATPLRGPRRAMARAMARARDRVARATATDRADVARWAATDTDVTLRLVRAVAAAAAAEPALNAWFDDAAETVTRHERIDLGLAVDTPDGLFVPVLRDAGAMTEAEIEAERARLLAAVRARRAQPADLRNPTITLSNFGMIAGRHADLVVVPPQVAILGAGRIGPDWVERGGEAAVGRCLPLSLSFDHRVVTGGEAARFLRAVIDDLERAE